MSLICTRRVVYTTSVDAICYAQLLAVKHNWNDSAWILYDPMHERAAAAMPEHRHTPSIRRESRSRDPECRSAIKPLPNERVPRFVHFQATPLYGTRVQISHRLAPKEGESLQAVCSTSEEQILHSPGKSWFFKSFITVSNLIVLDWRTSLRRLNSLCTATLKTVKH